MLKSALSPLAVLCLSAICVFGCAKKDDKGSKGPRGPATVGYIVVDTAPLNLTQDLSGRTSAFLVSEVRPQVTGIIKSRLFTEGGLVTAGQPLYQIDAATYQAVADSAQAQLAQAQASYEAAKIKADRATQLIAIKAISQQDFDDAHTSLKQTQAGLALQKAAVQSTRINLNYARVVSPISGRIGKSSVTPGALVTANQADALATVQDLSKIYVDITQSAADMLKLKRALMNGELGAADHADVQLFLDDGSTYTQTGQLEFSDVSVDPSTGSVTLRAMFANPQGLLLPGMYVRTRIVKGTVTEGILIPQESITLDAKGGASVLLAGPDNKAHKQAIKLGDMVGSKWQVNSGLKPGDRVITEGVMNLKPESPIKAAPVKPASGSEARGAPPKGT